MRLIIYRVLTLCIIVIGRIRARIAPREVLRFDRTLPWGDPQKGTLNVLRANIDCPERVGLYLQCCDCGLRHFMVAGHSGTPVRPAEYDYRLRAGQVSNLPLIPGHGAEVEDLFLRGIYSIDVWRREADDE